MNQTQCLFAVDLTFQRNFLQRQNDKSTSQLCFPVGKIAKYTPTDWFFGDFAHWVSFSNVLYRLCFNITCTTTTKHIHFIWF